MAKQLKFRAVIATTKTDANGFRFSEDCLKDMESQIKDYPVPVTVDFRHDQSVGVVTGAQLTDAGLVVEGILDVPIDALGLHMVPCATNIAMAIGDDGDARIVNARIRSVSLTDKPADTSILLSI